MSDKRYPDEFKLEAVRQVADRGHSVADKTLTEQGKAMIEAMGRGDLGPDEAASMLKALATQSQISKIDELAERISKLETRR